MRKLIFLFLLLSTTRLFGADVTTKIKAPQVHQPANTIDRVSKRTLYSKTFEHDLIGSGRFTTVISLRPQHYLDTTGTLKKFDLTERPAKTAGYEKRVNVGQSIFEYDSTGRLRYSKGESWFAVTPAFKEVGIEFTFSTTGLKAEYILTDKSPVRLAWGLTESSKGLAERKIEPFKAWDAGGKLVNVSVEYFLDSLVVSVDSAGTLFPITVDPTVQDTALAAAGQLKASAGDAQARRDAANAGVANLLSAADAYSAISISGVTRSAFQWELGPLTDVTAIDSAFLHYYHAASMTGDNDTMYVAHGEWTSNTLAVGWFSLFDGRTTAGAHTFTNMVDDNIFMTTANDGSWMAIRFSSTANDTIMHYINSTEDDTLRLMILNANDYRNRAAITTPYFYTALDSFPWLEIIHDSAPATVSHATTLKDADTLKVTGLAPWFALGASFDSSGAGLDSVGFVLHKKGVPADTITVVVDSADASWTVADSIFFVSTVITADTIAIDTAYVVAAFAATGDTRTYSGVNDTLSTAVTAGTVTTDEDSIIYVALKFAGTTGFTFTPNTTPITVRGIEYYYLGAGAADTDTILDTGGPWEEGVFTVTQDSIQGDTSLVYRSLSADITGDHVGDWDTLSTSGTGQEIAGQPINVMGVQGTAIVNY